MDQPIDLAARRGRRLMRLEASSPEAVQKAVAFIMNQPELPEGALIATPEHRLVVRATTDAMLAAVEAILREGEASRPRVLSRRKRALSTLQVGPNQRQRIEALGGVFALEPHDAPFF